MHLHEEALHCALLRSAAVGAHVAFWLCIYTTSWTPFMTMGCNTNLPRPSFRPYLYLSIVQKHDIIVWYVMYTVPG